MEGDDQQDPLVDTARSLLDGHVVLSRRSGGAQSLSGDFGARQSEPPDAGDL